MLQHPAQLGVCRLRRAKFKPGRKLTAYYDLDLQYTTERCVRSLAVTWVLPEAASKTAAMQASEEQALAQGLAAPFQHLTATLPAWGMQIQVSPLDPRFPQLLRLIDPQKVHHWLGQTGAGNDDYRIATIRYRPGQRHVLRYDPLSADTVGPGSIFAKLYMDASGGHFYGKIHQVAEWLSTQLADVCVLRPQAYLAPEQTLLYPWAAGRPLSQLLPARRNATLQLLQQLGRALRSLHDAPAALTQGLPAQELAAEGKAITRTCEHIQALLPTVGERVQRILERAQEGYNNLTQEAPTFVHGDCKADHVLVATQATGSLLTLIDFDSCALGDPASDIGKFLADLAWWHAQSNQAGLADAQGAFLTGYGIDAAGPRLQRARVWEALILLKMTAHRVPLFNRDWAQQTTALVRQVESLAFS
jgi:aminoglycoside phosphotransferase (APT) family kinase protein